MEKSSHESQPLMALVAIGSNLGDSQRTLSEVFQRLRQLSASPIQRSSIWESTPVDCPPDSPTFLNAAAALVPLPGETPESLLGKLQALEVEFGRTPKKVLNEPRPLDLDLIAWGFETRSTPLLTLPHPRAHERRFVLAPLTEIVPAFRLPGFRLTLQELLDEAPTDAGLRRCG